MNSKASLAILLAVSACLVSSSDAWGWRPRDSTKASTTYSKRPVQIRYESSKNANRTYPNFTVVAVRQVDEEHPYYQSFDIPVSNASVNRLKQSLREFFNRTSNVTRIVKNDHLLITRDIEVRMLNYKDYLEVWFQDSKAPTRSKTMYALSKDARKAISWSGKSDKDKSTKDKSTRDKSKSKREKKTRRGSEDVEVEDDEQFDFDQF